MKVACFALDGVRGIGLVDEAAAAVRPFEPPFADMVALIERFDEVRDGPRTGAPIPLAQVKLLAPIPEPRRNIFCVGKNYRDHAREFAGSGFEAGAVKGQEIDAYPAVFTKPPSSVIGPGDTVDLHANVTQAVDYEAELTIVIGKAGRDIPAERAFEHIFGYTIINDVTARDRQKNHKQWFMGKALDTFCPMGPWITTADEIDAETLQVICRVNGELRQNANTRDLIFGIPSLIATISGGLTLVPGDLIATGTPAGVGIGFNPPKFLEAGDEVAITISGIGTLMNRFA
ncbi:fumarylacetoacetate hydrolase family protein [Prosthecomicrobium sp. N25]|uniref:fumarylacetoacetate hydrolase family protein n=1 Tax=Prosthecomicrobium sp. N25 TaxID=3129254 RepID=UPI00307895B7